MTHSLPIRGLAAGLCLSLAACAAPSSQECDPGAGGFLQYLRCKPSGYDARLGGLEQERDQARVRYGGTMRSHEDMANRLEAASQQRDALRVAARNLHDLNQRLVALHQDLVDQRIGRETALRRTREILAGIETYARTAREVLETMHEECRSATTAELLEDTNMLLKLVADVTVDFLIPDEKDLAMLLGGNILHTVFGASRQVVRRVNGVFGVFRFASSVHDNWPTICRDIERRVGPGRY